MSSTVAVPNYAQIANYPPAQAKAIVDLATQAQADINALQTGAVPGTSPVHNVDLATAAALPAGTATATTFTVTATGTLTVDGVVTTLNQRILVKDQVAAADNGIFYVSTAGSAAGPGVKAVLTRAPDGAVIGDYQPGTLVATGPAGTANPSVLFEQTTAAPTALHVDAISYGLVATAITAGAGLKLTGSVMSSKTATAAGANLTDTGTQSIDIAGGSWRKLPTLGQNGALTLATTGSPVAGDKIKVTRSSTSAFTYAVINGGGGAGTLFTFPQSVSGFAVFQFDGTNWALQDFGILPVVATTTVAGYQSAADKLFQDRQHSATVALTDAPTTLDVATGTWYTMPAATLGADRAMTLSPTVGTPLAGDQITITRLDAGAHAMTIVDGGPGTPTLMTMPNSKTACAVCQFDGANWKLRTAAVDFAA